MDSIIPLLISLGSGALGGNIAGKVLNSRMGTAGRSLVGIVGGAIFAWIASMVPGLSAMFASPTTGTMSVGGVVAAFLSGAIGGALLTAIIGAFGGRR